MAKFAVFFRYQPDAWDRMIMKPSDRARAVRPMIESLGGTLEAMYFMFGDRDGFVIVDVPSPQDAAAISVAVSSTGAFTHMETRQLLDPADLSTVLEKAGRARESYSRPGD